MLRSLGRLLVLSVPLALVCLHADPAVAQPAEGEGAKRLPPERTYSKQPYVHRIPLLDAEGNVIRAPKPEDDKDARPAPVSLATTCGKCHSDYNVMTHGWHSNFADANAPHGRPGEPWLLTDARTRSQIPLSYRGWRGTFHPYDLGLNDFGFAKLFARHHPGGSAFDTSEDLRFKMSGPLALDCLICHTTSETGYDTVARAEAISDEENFRQAPTLAAFLGTVTGMAARLKDDFDPNGRDARRAPRVTYDASRFDAQDRVLFDLVREVPNDRCYACHTSLDVGQADDDNGGLESRWRHAGDIHLAQGMQCVDCHTNGADHMTVRGYEGEALVRARAEGVDTIDPAVTTLSCRGCHYGTEQTRGGKAGAPRPEHRGLPTLHLEEITCTACHSGPMPADATKLVQTSMAHKLGLPRHHATDGAAPQIQQPVFLRVDGTGNVVEPGEHGKLAPHRVVYPSFWGRLNGEAITPIQPKHVAGVAGIEEILGPERDAKRFEAFEPLTNEQVAQVLEKLAAAEPPQIPPAEVVTARNQPAPTTAPAAPATTTASTAPVAEAPAKAELPQQQGVPAWATGEPVYVTGGKVYKRGANGQGLEAVDHPAAKPYAWALAHDVRPAQQSLGARGCVECHATDAPIFNSSVSSAAVLTDASAKTPMHEVNGQSMGALNTFAATYPLRPILITVGYVCAGVLGLVLLTYAAKAIGSTASAAAASRRP